MLNAGRFLMRELISVLLQTLASRAFRRSLKYKLLVSFEVDVYVGLGGLFLQSYNNTRISLL